MLSITNNILRQSSAMLARELPPAAAGISMINTQQNRYTRSTRTFRAQWAYGRVPLYTEEAYQEAKENGSLDQLKFEKIRMAYMWETNSPFYDKTLDTFIRDMMHDGRLSLWNELLHQTLYRLKAIQYQRQKKLQEKGGKMVNADGEEITDIETNPIALLHKALKNGEPILITKKIRRGGATYQVPFPLKKSQSEWLSRKWFHEAVIERPKPRKARFFDVLAQEILDACENRGKVIRRRDDMHRLADANKAYAHYRWG